MSLKSTFLNCGRVVHDASFALLEPCSLGERLKTVAQLVRIGFSGESPRGGTAVVGRRSFRVRYMDAESFRQAYHEIFMRQTYFFRAESDSPLIVDCGANIGIATLYFKTLYPRSIVEAFEPDPSAFAVLKENIACNALEGVRLHQCALWDSEGEVDFYVDKLSEGRLSMSVFSGRIGEHETRITVRARPLAAFLGDRTVDFLKIDVEGSEERLLGNLVDEGKLKNVRQMAIEYHPFHLDRDRPHLSRLLAVLEAERFVYEIYADMRPRSLRDPLHDVLILARRQSFMAGSTSNPIKLIQGLV
jgi:FkbM family methyltransferase